MSTTMITLVGGRTPPIVAIAARQFADLDNIYFLISRDSRETYQGLKAIFEKEFPTVSLHNVDNDETSNYVNAFDKNEIQQKCQMIMEKISSTATRPVVQLTSGTQVMCVAAYEVAKKWDAPAIYVNTAGGEILDLVHNNRKPITSQVDVRYYAAIYGFQAKPNKLMQGLSLDLESAKRLSRKFANEMKTLQSITKKLNQAKKNNSGHEYFPAPSINKFQLPLFNELKQRGIVHTNGDKIRIKSADWEFLKGKWLEVLTYACAHESGFFHDCQLSVQLDNEADCDVFCIRQAIPMIIECKTGGNIHVGDLKNLERVAGRLGGNYCLRVIVYTGDLTKGVKDSSAYKVECVPLKELINDSTCLKKVFEKRQSSLR
jgi:hypothetical protein